MRVIMVRPQKLKHRNYLPKKKCLLLVGAKTYASGKNK